MACLPKTLVVLQSLFLLCGLQYAILTSKTCDPECRVEPQGPVGVGVKGGRIAPTGEALGQVSS